MKGDVIRGSAVFLCNTVNISLMNNDKRIEMFRRLKQANPEPKTELEYTSAFELLVAVTLSAQATDISVNKATVKLFAVANTPAQILALGVDGLKPYIRTIGLFNTKAKNVVAACRMLCEEHDGIVPDNREALEALPGVGRKTANVVLNTAFRQLAMAVDTHIFRVSNRTGLAPGKNVVAVEKALLRFVPKDYLLDAHHWLILHGRYVCVARTPRCPECPIIDLCDFRSKTKQDEKGKLIVKSVAKKRTKAVAKQKSEMKEKNEASASSSKKSMSKTTVSTVSKKRTKTVRAKKKSGNVK